jgi:hypothetical protein
VKRCPFSITVYMGEEKCITLANQNHNGGVRVKGNNVVGKLYTDILL